MKTVFMITGLEDCGLTKKDADKFVAHLADGRTRVKHTDLGNVQLYVFTYTFWNWLRSIFSHKAK